MELLKKILVVIKNIILGLCLLLLVGFVMHQLGIHVADGDGDEEICYSSRVCV